MLARFRYAPFYVAAIIACFFVAWIFAHLVVQYFGVGNSGEHGFRAVILSIPLTITFSLVAVGVLRRKLKKQNEERA